MYLARGEGAVFGAVLAILALLQRPLGESVRLYWAAALAGVASIALWHGFYFQAFGELLPSTLKAKQLQAEGGFTTFDAYLPTHLRQLPAPIALDPSDSRLITNSLVLASGIAVLLWRAPLLVAWPLVHIAVYAQVGVPSYHWYYYPIDFLRGLAPIIAVAAVAAGAIMIARTRLLRAEPTRALVLATLGMTAAGAMLLQPVLAHSNPVHLETARPRAHRGSSATGLHCAGRPHARHRRTPRSHHPQPRDRHHRPSPARGRGA
jgi:hypothetical protein